MSNPQIFISYSRRNSNFVEQLITDLKQLGFDIWLDKQDLEVGTASWERAIRKAIKEAGAVILVASPDALASDYVQGELTLAKLYHRPIYPIWADGDSWMECVPLDMANYQYVDGRSNAYSVAIEALRTSLAKEFDLSEGTIKLGLPTHETVDLNIAQFDAGFDLLSYVWINYLQGWYEPFTYG